MATKDDIRTLDRKVDGLDLRLAAYAGMAMRESRTYGK